METSDPPHVAENETEDGYGQTRRQRCEEVINPPRNHHRYSDPNQILLFGEYALMKIGETKYTIFDRRYVDDVKECSWHFCNGYAQHNATKKSKAMFGEKGAICLHEFILKNCEKRHEPDGNINIDHRNRCKQDNRACNLRYATIGNNTSNRTYERIRTNIDALNKAGIHEFWEIPLWAISSVCARARARHHARGCVRPRARQRPRLVYERARRVSTREPRTRRLEDAESSRPSKHCAVILISSTRRRPPALPSSRRTLSLSAEAPSRALAARRRAPRARGARASRRSRAP